MKGNLKKVFAVALIFIIAFGWLMTIHSAGPVEPIKDRINLGLDIKGGAYVVLEADKDALKGKTAEEKEKIMEQTQSVIEQRVNEMGLAEPTVTTEGDNRIRVELPGVKDSDEAIQQIGKTAQLKFILADGTQILDGGDVKDAEAGRDDQSTGYAVNLQFSGKGADAFGEATTKAFNGEVESKINGMDSHCIAIILDDETISAPRVNEPIMGGKCSITGDFTSEEATNMAALIRGGALPIELHEVTSSVQSAKIGFNALEMSVYAGLIGLGLILIVMLVVYGGLGIAADIGLLLYTVLLINIFAAMDATLTLPGIAGIILSIGMAVDANVIIFSRIREEMAKGRSVRVAAAEGYKRGLSTVMDSQITTLIAAVILFEIGTSSVKGFAFTFMLGIILSILTAVFITQLYVNIAAENKGLNGLVKKAKRITIPVKIINKKKIFYTCSAVIIIAGILFTGVRGLNYGIDFTGGTMIHMDMGKQVKITQVEKAIAKYDLSPEIVYSGNDNSEIVLKTKKALDNDARQEVITSINESFGTTNQDVLSQELFGPSVGKELRNNAILAIVIAALCMLIYIRIRFRNWKFGSAAIAGVMHDVLIVISLYAIFGITVNNPFIAGILTVVGYSINDTIVIFDRVRENLGLLQKESLSETLDKSISQTIGRSLMTSLTTIIVMVPMIIMAGDAIREFVFPLMAGVIAGTYSSICVCSPLYHSFAGGDKKSRYLSHIAKKSKN